MSWGTVLIIVTGWVLVAVSLVRFIQAATRVSTPVPVGYSFPIGDQGDALIENCVFKWDPVRKVLTITPANPGARLTVRDNLFDCGQEMTIAFEQGTTVLRSVVQ